MGKLILDQAQIAMDDFYQEYRDAKGFFEIEDFARALVDERDSRLEAEYFAQLRNKKLDYPIVNPAWVKHVFVPIEKDKETGQYVANICEPVYQFPEDEYGFGIQDVDPFGSDCAEFIRITNGQAWQVCLAAPNNCALFSVDGCRILLYNFFGCTEKLDVRIVPSQSALPLEQQTLPDGHAAMIREAVLTKFIRNYNNRLGKIPAVVDGNPNPQPNETGKAYTLKTQ